MEEEEEEMIGVGGEDEGEAGSNEMCFKGRRRRNKGGKLR